MATGSDHNHTSHPLDEVAKQIEDSFDRLIQYLLGRKLSLLAEIEYHRIEYDNSVANRFKIEKDLTSLKQPIENVRRKELKTIQNDNLATIEEKLNYLNDSIILEFEFEIDTHSIEEEISKWGRIIKKTINIPDYSVMKMPLVAGRRLVAPRGIAYEEESELIFVCDQPCIKIFNLTGEFVSSFGCNELHLPNAVVLHGSFIYVLDRKYSIILKYERTSYQFIKASKNGFEINFLLAMGPDGFLYAPESVESRILMFDSELDFKRSITHECLCSPVDVAFNNDTMFVLNGVLSKGVHSFNLNGEYIECIIANQSDIFVLFFHIDCIGNILISAWMDHTILVFNKTGQLLHSLGKQGDDKGEFYLPAGITTTRSGRLIVVSRNTNYGLQIF